MVICGDYPPRETSDWERENQIPGYMRPTRCSIVLSDPSPEKKRPTRPSAIFRPVDPDKLPNYMKPTEASRKQVEVVTSPIRKPVVREVDPNNLPSYMRSTKAWDKQIEPETSVKKSGVIKPVDPSNLPSYMRSTKAWDKRVEKVEKESGIRGVEQKEGDVKIASHQSSSSSDKSIKTSGANELPNFMRPTKAWEKWIEPKTESKERGTTQNGRRMQCVSKVENVGQTSQTGERMTRKKGSFQSTEHSIPRYMQPTKATTAKMEAVAAQLRDREEEKKKKEESTRQLHQKDEYWKKQREEANRRIFGK